MATASVTTPQARILELVQALSEDARLYYALGTPRRSDAAYDADYRELVALEAAHPDLIQPDSPTQRVGAPVAGDLVEVAHTEPMLSLANALDQDELAAFFIRTDVPEDTCWVVEPKIDGIALSLTYDDGLLVQATTRGDGIVGEDVTHAIRTIRDLPLRIPHSGRLVVRGECYQSRAAFGRCNERRAARGDEPLMNPRNATAGAVRALDPAVAADRELSFYAYGIDRATATALDVTSHAAAMAQLADFGFATALELGGDIDGMVGSAQVTASCQALEARRDSLPCEIDGAVVKLDAFAEQERLGARSREPRWAIAYKFAPREVSTQLIDVVWQVGRTGRVTPRAEVAPVELGGTTVRHATLHNPGEISRMDLRLGDTVLLQRAGDVIPRITGPMPAARTGTETAIVVPAQCPCCGESLDASEAVLRCLNVAGCSAQLERRLLWWGSRDALDIEGLGEGAVSDLIDHGLVTSLPDLYRLDVTALAALDGWGEKSAVELVRAIEASKTASVRRIFVGFGLRRSGRTVSRILAPDYPTIAALQQATVEELAAYDGIGPVIAESIVAAFANPDFVAILDELRALGVALDPDATVVAEATTTPGIRPDALAGLSVVVTGTLPTLGRAEAEELIRQAGGTASGSVSKKTALLVAGDKAGSKLAKATALGVEIIDEAELRRRVGC